jgi:predicted transposase/invertase (TIGR01784 family)
MNTRKTIQQLTLRDNFMFGAVMLDPEICRELLERILQKPIRSVTVDIEKSLVYHPEYHGIRLDVEAADEEHTHYNVEMQALVEPAPGKRSRYYHSQIDMELLASGTAYSDLPDCYVIFLCDYDPFGYKKYCYTFTHHCSEQEDLFLPDGSHTIFLSTVGTNDKEVPEELVKFLHFLHADLPHSTEDYQDDFIRNIQKRIQQIKDSREMGKRYMQLEEMLQREYEDGKRDGKLEGRLEGKLEGQQQALASAVLNLLELSGPVSDDLRESILAEQDLDKLNQMLLDAAKTSPRT